MARTSRGGGLAAVDAGALDDLDLDNMFDDDMLFDGLDIEFEGMGDIVTERGAHSAPPPPRRGPKTQRTNPMIEMAEAQEKKEASAQKRRKTRRKTKIPVAFGDDDDDYVEDQPRKKQRRAAAMGKNKAPASPVSADSKKRKKTKKGEALAPTSSKTKKGSIVPPTSGVAAAGRFGKRGGSTGANSKNKRKAKGSGRDSLSGSAEGYPSPLPLFRPQGSEPTFGGLRPSKVMFYPFMESVPPEPSLKARKLFPVLDRISSALTSHLNASSIAAFNDTKKDKKKKDDKHGTSSDMNDAAGTDAIFKLLAETYESSDREKAAFTAEKQKLLLKAIPKLRDTIKQYEKTQLIKDLYSMCGLLNRQFNFLKQSLDNMNGWCKTEFSKSDYQATYAKPTPKLPEYHKWPQPSITVRLVFSNNKEITRGLPLTAILPSFVIKETPLTKASSSDKTAAGKKKKKEKSEKKESTTTSSSVSAPAYKSYADCSPLDRRLRITEAVSKLALELEADLQTKTLNAVATRTGTAQKPANGIPDEDTHLYTTQMWDFLGKTGFYAPPTKTELGHSPETHPRGSFLPIPKKIYGRPEDDTQISSNSLFDRLQSLLVEEKEEDDDEVSVTEGSQESEDEDDEEDSLAFLDEADEDDVEEEGMADLSKLNLEERTFIHLKSIGLIQQSLFPKVELVLSERKKDEQKEEMVNVIGEMSAELSKLTGRNNARMSYLNAVVNKMDLSHTKQMADQEASIIARCQSLLKRNKEKAKKSNKQKKDDLNLPW